MRIALVGAELEEGLAVRYIWGALRQAGHEVLQVVFNRERDIDEAARKIALSGADIAGFSMVFTYRAREFARLAQAAREYGYSGHIVAGGHFAAFNAERLLSDISALDSIACGEGEEIMCDLAANGGDPTGVAGLVWRRGDGSIVRNDPAVKPPELDSLPLPVRKTPFDSYLGLPIANMLSSRGCTHSCAFCSISAWHRMCGGKRYRMRSPELVADEMADLYSQGVRIFNFHDDNFILDDKAATFERLKALKKGLDTRGVGRIAFAIKARPDYVEEDLFAYLKSMGLFRVFLGIEAGSPRSLKDLHRGQTREQNEQALEIVNRLDIHTCFNLLLLNPDSTEEDFKVNVAFLRTHPGNPMNFCRTEIYAGTPLEKKLRREGRLLGDYWGYDYRIADPRAQKTFENIFAHFTGRSYSDDCVHHLTMDLDYEYQLLAHFHGPIPALRARVKNFVKAVNVNTCDHLDNIMDPGMPLALTRDDARFRAEGAKILVDIRGAIPHAAGTDKAHPRCFCRHCMKAAAAAGVAAALTVGAGCKPHVSEMAPRPIAIAADSALQREIMRKVLWQVAFQLPQDSDIKLNVWINDKGEVVSCQAQSASPGDSESVTIQGAIGLSLDSAKDGKLGAGCYVMTIPKGVVEGMTHPCEIIAIPPKPAPPPVQPPDNTHMREMRAVPPVDNTHMKEMRAVPPKPPEIKPEPDYHMFEMAPLPRRVDEKEAATE